jgi:hypothetical protein
MVHVVEKVTVSGIQQRNSDRKPEVIGKATPKEATAIGDPRVKEHASVLNAAHGQHMVVCGYLRLRSVR